MITNDLQVQPRVNSLSTRVGYKAGKKTDELVDIWDVFVEAASPAQLTDSRDAEVDLNCKAKQHQYEKLLGVFNKPCI